MIHDVETRWSYSTLKLFKDKKDTALAIPTDSAWLTMKKNKYVAFDCCVVESPTKDVLQAKNIIMPPAIPGLAASKNLESFIFSRVGYSMCVVHL